MMQQNESLELYGQGETLLEAFGMLVRAVDEYGDPSDKENIMEALADMKNFEAVSRRIAP
jgi:hypothetical protein